MQQALVWGLLSLVAGSSNDGQCSGASAPSLMQVTRLVAKGSDVETGGLGGELDFIQAMAEKVAGHNYTMTDAEKQALEAIKNVVKSMIVTIDTQHQEDQNEVNRVRDDIKYCAEVAANASLVAAGLNTGVTAARNTNSNCRNQQSTGTGTQNTLCTYYHNYRKSNAAIPNTCMSNHLTQSYIKTDVASELADMETCLQKTKTWIDPLYKAYKDCRDQVVIITNLSTQCDSDQGSFESKYCAWATKNDDTCDAQTQCRSHEIAKRTTVHGNVSASESARQSDYRASQKVLCFFKVFEANNANKSATLQGCLNLVVDVSNYTITYPGVPAAHPCTKSTHKPCDPSWVSTEYTSQAWHSSAPAATCTPCPAPATTPPPVTGYTCGSTIGSAPLVQCESLMSNMNPATQSVWDSRTPAGCNYINGDMNLDRSTESITFTGLKKVQAWVHLYGVSVSGLEMHFPDLEYVNVFLFENSPGVVAYSTPCLTTVHSPDPGFKGYGNTGLTDQAWLDGVCNAPIAVAGTLGSMQSPSAPDHAARTLQCPTTSSSASAAASNVVLPSGDGDATGAYIQETRSFTGCGDNVDLSGKISFTGNEHRTGCVWFKQARDTISSFNLFEFGGGGCYNRWALGRWFSEHGTTPTGLVVHTWCNYPGSDPTTSDSDWHHACSTWDGTNMLVYFDGELKNWVSYSPNQFHTLNTGSEFNLWGSYDTRFCYEGEQANLVLLKRAAAPEEIRDFMSATDPRR